MPPWLRIDPIEPARILQRSNAQRGAQAIAERNAQIQYQRLQQEQEMQNARLAAQERASERHAQVLKETRDAELAQHAAQLQMRREQQAMRAQQFERQLRIREKAAEQEAASAARKMEGMKAVQEGLKAGVPLEKLLAENAPNLFADKPQALGQTLRAVTPVGMPKEATNAAGQSYLVNSRTGTPTFAPRAAAGVATGPITAQPILDESGKPVGGMAIRGPHGGVQAVRPQMTLAERAKILTDRLAVIKGLIEEPDSPAQEKLLKKQRDGILKELEDMTAPSTEKAAGKEMENIPPEELAANELEPGEEEPPTDEEDLEPAADDEDLEP